MNTESEDTYILTMREGNEHEERMFAIGFALAMVTIIILVGGIVTAALWTGVQQRANQLDIATLYSDACAGDTDCIIGLNAGLLVGK